MNKLPAILAAFRDEFPDETACATYLERLRWPSGLVCTSCAVVAEPYRIASRPGVLRCRSCKTETRVAVGTAMERSRTPLYSLVRSRLPISPGQRPVVGLGLSGPAAAWVEPL